MGRASKAAAEQTQSTGLAADSRGGAVSGHGAALGRKLGLVFPHLPLREGRDEGLRPALGSLTYFSRASRAVAACEKKPEFSAISFLQVTCQSHKTRYVTSV